MPVRLPRRLNETEGRKLEMTDSTDKPTLGRKPLGLKTSVQAGEVKQTFSHGRTNKVVVEVKRRKLIGKPGEAAPTPAPEPEVVVEAPKAPPPKAPPPVSAESRQEMQTRLLREAGSPACLA